MSGLLYVIDQLGENLSRLTTENAQLRDELARLRAAAAEGEAAQPAVDECQGGASWRTAS